MAESDHLPGPVVDTATPAATLPFPLQPPETIEEEQHFHLRPHQQEQPDGVVDMQPKRRNRQRLLRGLSRISSSPSLAQLGRARSSSTPYSRSGASLSCVSLASGSSPFAPTPSNASSSGFAFSPLASPAAGGLSGYPSSSTSLSSPLASPSRSGSPGNGATIRKVDLAAEGTAATGTGSANGGNTVPLPVEIARATSASVVLPYRPRKTFAQMWTRLPREAKVHIFRFLSSKELIRVSRVSREFYKLSFDGQLWTSFDASEFYQEIPVESLSKIITTAGPFVKNLNLRGCVQVEKYHDAIAMSKALSNLVDATLEGSLFNFHNLEYLLKRNKKLVRINLTGLSCVNINTCNTISANCAQLEILNVSWCKNITGRHVEYIVKACPKLRDLRVGEIPGFDSREVAQTIFKTNRLERLVLSGCPDLDDTTLGIMMHGIDPEMDLLTDRPKVPPRRLRHLDLSRCPRLTSRGVSSLGYCVPELEGLVLNGNPSLTDDALDPIFASCPNLSYLDLEDLTALTNPLLSEHLVKSACATKLTHLSISYCENLGDAGVLPAIRACHNLRSIDMDNTRISDLVLAEAAAMVRGRAPRTHSRHISPRPGLSMAVYDCPNVNWTGVREVLSRNAEVVLPRAKHETLVGGGPVPLPTYPTEIISLKCFYGWQMTVDEHTKRVLRGDLASAVRLERKWADYMQASEEAGAGGAGIRRRRRRAREAQQLHATEEVGGVAAGPGIGRRRARTATCAVM